ncbi:MAG: hypothetical protein JXA11_12740 [Phycisphaerae bacterium]|nr:hypothetical protein [Phycisphaerae bacterium]
MGMERVIVFMVSLVMGILVIVAGYISVKTRYARDGWKQQRFNRLLGRSGEYYGKTAVRKGWMRIIVGIAIILFGIVFLFVGPFLKGVS